MLLIETKLDYVKRKHLIFLIKSKLMPVQSFSFIIIVIIYRLETHWAFIGSFNKIFLITRITFFGAYFYHQQLILWFFVGVNINLPHSKFQSSLLGWKLKPFLANSLNPVGPWKLVGPVHFIHPHKYIINNITLTLKIVTLLSLSNCVLLYGFTTL